MSNICKYFLNGNCRYGDRCRFRHVYDQGENYYYDDQNYNKSRQQNSKGMSILRSNNNQNYPNNCVAAGNSNYNVTVTQSSQFHYSSNDRVALITQNPSVALDDALREIDQLENGHQWLLTCFCPLKETSIAPGWIDHSPEELRWECYKASKDGTFENCKLSIQNLYKEAQERRNEFKYGNKGLAIIETMLRNKKEGISFPRDAVLNADFHHSNANAAVNNVFGSFSEVTPQTISLGSAFDGVPQQNVTLQQKQEMSRAFHDPAPGFSFALNSKPTDTTNNSALTPFSTLQGNNNVSGSSFVSSEQNPVPAQSSHNENIYSLVADITEHELILFQANTFQFGQVPVKPPTKELCFKL